MIIENEIGFEDEDGFIIGYKPEFALLNCCRKEEFKKPILKRNDVEVGER